MKPFTNEGKKRKVLPDQTSPNNRISPHPSPCSPAPSGIPSSPPPLNSTRQLLQQEPIPNPHPLFPPLLALPQLQIVNMPLPFNLRQPAPDTHLPERLRKRDRRVERHDLVLRTVDEERRRRVRAAAEMGERRDACDEGRGRRRRPERAGGRADAVEEEGKAVAFFEEGEDKLGAGVARVDPAEVAAVGGGGGGGVGCYLWGRGRSLAFACV